MRPITRLCFLLCCLLGSTSVTAATNLLSRDCEPLRLVDRFSSFNKHCEYLTNVNDDPDISAFFAALPSVDMGRPFPLRGCVAGCLNGNSWKRYVSASIGRGNGWGGFCFEESAYGAIFTSYIANQLTRKPIVAEDSWSSLPFELGCGSVVWAVNYDDDGPVLGDYEIIRQEMRQSAKGAVTVKVFVKPISSSSEVVYKEFHYNLLQICARDGDYLYRPVTKLPGKDGLV